MQTVQEIEKAILKLSRTDLLSFREWFEQFEQEKWDEQFEKDVKAGRFDQLADQAIADFKTGKCRDL
jgi:hypothetical protein